MRVLNWSYRVGCLQCSFNDKDLNEYVQLKKRRSVLQKKSAVQKIGRQFNNTWILGEDFCITSSGYPITSSESKYVMCFPVQESHRHHWDAIFCFLILLNL